MSTSSLELPTVARPAHASRCESRIELVEHDRLIGRAKALSWLSLAYMTAEGAIAITAAILSSSVALLGFGLDSAIEGLASIIVIWRFTGSRRLSQHAELRAQRLVGSVGRRGETCCAASPLPGEPLDACDQECCA
jgi:hypothetical protein